MRKPTLHRLVFIALLLIAFGVPFYIERGQTSAQNNAYVVGAVLSNSKISSSQSPQNNLAGSPINAWAEAAGTSFIGGQVN